MKKKSGIIFLMLTIVLVLAACGNGNNDMASGSAEDSSSSEMTSNMEDSEMEDSEMKSEMEDSEMEDSEMKSEMEDSEMEDSSMEDSMNESTAMLTGSFSGQNDQMVSGMVKFSEDKLMLTDFKTSDGPDLHVYLTKDGDVSTGKSIGEVDLEKAEQSFSLNGVNPNEYNTVVIYCEKAHVVFGDAKLM